jgi:hypothetical protein
MSSFPLTFAGVEQILWLEVPVSDVHIVQKLDGHADVFHNFCRLCKIFQIDMCSFFPTLTLLSITGYQSEVKKVVKNLPTRFP